MSVMMIKVVQRQIPVHVIQLGRYRWLTIALTRHTDQPVRLGLHGGRDCQGPLESHEPGRLSRCGHRLWPRRRRRRSQASAPGTSTKDSGCRASRRRTESGDAPRQAAIDLFRLFRAPSKDHKERSQIACLVSTTMFLSSDGVSPFLMSKHLLRHGEIFLQAMRGVSE